MKKKSNFMTLYCSIQQQSSIDGALSNVQSVNTFLLSPFCKLKHACSSGDSIRIISTEDAEELFSQSSCFPPLITRPIMQHSILLYLHSLYHLCAFGRQGINVSDSSCLFAEIKTKSIVDDLLLQC